MKHQLSESERGKIERYQQLLQKYCGLAEADYLTLLTCKDSVFFPSMFELVDRGFRYFCTIHTNVPPFPNIAGNKRFTAHWQMVYAFFPKPRKEIQHVHQFHEEIIRQVKRSRTLQGDGFRLENYLPTLPDEEQIRMSDVFGNFNPEPVYIRGKAFSRKQAMLANPKFFFFTGMSQFLEFFVCQIDYRVKTLKNFHAVIAKQVWHTSQHIEEEECE